MAGARAALLKGVDQPADLVAQCPDRAYRPRRAELFSESRAPAAILRPAALRTGATLRDPRRERPNHARALLASTA